MRPKGEGHGCPESNPPSGSVRLLGKFRSRLNFFRIEEIDALHVCPQGEVQECTESNSLRSDKSRFFPEFPYTRSPGSEGIINDKAQHGVLWQFETQSLFSLNTEHKYN